MRKELELIEKIEAYLQGRLSPAETQEFEQQLAGDAHLRTEVELQRQLMTGIQRASLREQVLTAKKRFHFLRRMTRWGLGGLAVAAAVAALLYYKHSSHPYKVVPDAGLPALNESGDTLWADADKYLPAQTWLIAAGRDTVIETRKGIVLAIPAQTFLDKGNHPATGQIRLTLKEALDPADILKAGLSTRSGTQILSTGGMFFLDARQQDDILHIDTARPVIAQIPAKGDPAGMQLYKGQRKTNGTIDWTDPRPLQHGLMAVDIGTLDFYPPHYLDSLSKWGYDSRDRHFTDSLYYSLSAFYQQLTASEDVYKTDTTPYHPLPCGINPAKIKTIWSGEFNNTLLATREFQERLQMIHRCNGANELLDLYVHHLDGDLSGIDSLVATQSTGEQKEVFLQFAARHDGKVNNASPQLRRLAAYYEIKARAYTAAIAKTEQEYWSRQAELDNAADARKAQRQMDSFRHSTQNLTEELTLNLRSAYKQLGVDTTINPNPPAATVYTATISATGWYNIDKAVTEATVTRTTLEYTDPRTGKKVIIRYQPVTFRIADWQRYDRLYVYLLPNELSSFMLLSGTGGVYTENLNGLIKYDLVCLGYKGEQAFYYHRDSIQPHTYDSVRLSSISPEELTRQLNQAGSMTQGAQLLEENTFFRLDIQDQKRRKHNEKLEELTWRLRRVIMPCWIPGV